MKTILVDAIGAFVIEGEGISNEMYDLLETFPNPKIILTGADDDQMKEFGLDQMPYPIFTLKHDPEKANPSYYEKMFENFNLTKEDVVYFEHSEKAVESARSVGIATYYYDSDRKDLESLKSFLTENI